MAKPAHENLAALRVPLSLSLISPVPAKKKKPDRHFNVGDDIRVKLSAGRIVDATVKAVIEHTDGVRLQVDFGKDETALVHLWQVVN